MILRSTRLLPVLCLVCCGPAVATPSARGEGDTTSAAVGTTPSAGAEPSSGSGITSSETSNGLTRTTGLIDTAGGVTSTGYGTGNLCGEWNDSIPFCCNAVAQNCGVGEKCSWWANDGGSVWNATRCVPISPNPDPLGGSCTMAGSFISGVDTCQPGTMCFWVVPETNEGECAAFCAPEAAEEKCLSGTRCHRWEPEEIAMCLPDCDPLSAACSHSTCSRTEQGFACLPRHTELGEAFFGCELTTGCNQGLSCLDADRLAGCEFERCCAPYCDLTEPLCPEGTTCLPYFADEPVLRGHEDLGFCGAST